MKNCLSLLTFIPMEEVNRLSSLKDEKINEAKQVLAYEVTRQVHGEEAAQAAEAAAKTLFAGAEGGEAPTTEITAAQFAENSKVIDLLLLAGADQIPGRGPAVDHRGRHLGKRRKSFGRVSRAFGGELRRRRDYD